MNRTPSACYSARMPPLPPLRNIDAFPIEHDGEQLICLHDPAGYVEAQLLLSPAAFFIAACLDGAHGLADIAEAFAQQFGARPAESEIQRVVDMLSEQGFLFDARFQNIARDTHAAFAAAKARPAWLAGRSYAADPQELRAQIDAFFLRNDGPGAPPACTQPDAPPLPCLIAPHIDFERGGHSYAHAYRALYARGKPETVFIFGVAHNAAPVPFILTQKDFETPFGTLETDREAVEKIAAAAAWDPYQFEAVHRTEHSAEFQAVMLAYLYGPAVRIVPVLASCIADDPTVTRPGSIDAVRRFLDACAEIAADSRRRVSVIAGADLAHVGRRFGDDFEIDADIVKAVARRDSEDLVHVLRPAPEEFYASVMRDQNSRRVCGLGCIYAALHTARVENRNGELLHYGYAPDPHGGIVSFASLAIA